MTTIAIRGRTIATDGQLTAGGLSQCSNQKKIFHVKDGLAACTGTYAPAMKIIRHLAAKSMMDQVPEGHEDVVVIVLTKSGEVYIIEKNGHYSMDASGGYLAFGSGKEIALGAFWKGATPAEAVLAAAAFDTGTNGNVQQETI